MATITTTIIMTGARGRVFLRREPDACRRIPGLSRSSRFAGDLVPRSGVFLNPIKGIGMAIGIS